MSDPLTLPQRLALVKYLTDRLAEVRKDDLLPQAADDLTSGERLAVRFGGRHAGFVTMPEPSKKSAYVSDEAALLTWAKKHYPAKVEPTVSVAVDDELITFLDEHYPAALRKGEQVDPQWVSDIQAGLKDKGFYVTITGEKLTGVPGITLPEQDPAVPRVNLGKDAGAIIAAAWQAGLIEAGDLLALPASQVPQ